MGRRPGANRPPPTPSGAGVGEVSGVARYPRSERDREYVAHRGGNPGMAIEFREGGVTVTLSPALEELARRALEVALPGVVSLMERRVRATLDEAAGDWPVRTGVSRAGLRAVTI